MAKEAFIEMNCSRFSDKLIDMIDIFQKIGWTYYNPRHKIEYLPLGDDGDYDWQEDSMSGREIKRLLNKKQKNNEMIGISLYCSYSSEGFDLIAKNTEEIRLSLDINRRLLESSDHEDSTDIGWYVENIIHKLRQDNCPVDYYKIEEYEG